MKCYFSDRMLSSEKKPHFYEVDVCNQNLCDLVSLKICLKLDFAICKATGYISSKYFCLNMSGILTKFCFIINLCES